MLCDVLVLVFYKEKTIDELGIEGEVDFCLCELFL